MKTPNYILGLDEADMKKIRGFRLRLVTFFFPSLIEVLKETASNKATYQKRWLDETDYTNELKRDVNRLTRELERLRGSRDERLRKGWKGKDGKITHDELASFTGLMGRTNQDVRDAALLAWAFAGLPIRVKLSK